MWAAEESLRADECPNCGIDGHDLMDYTSIKLTCAVCKHEYLRVKAV